MEDGSAHLGYSLSTIGEDDRQLGYAQSSLGYVPSELYLKAISIGSNLVEVDGLKGSAMKAFEATG